MCGEASLDHFVRRTLTYIDSKGAQRRISDEDLSTQSGPVVLLGEPGSGKSWLLRKISSRPTIVFRSAAAFVAHPDPASLSRNSALLVIDGLDELAAVRESDPVNQVLGQLIRAGCPSFILSCRVADWRGAVARQDIAEEYGASPRELILEPLSRAGAVEFLTASLPGPLAEQVIKYLEEKGIPDLYGNPLTLRLFSEIAATSPDLLPSSRADLLDRACEIMWRELNDRHDNSSLSAISKDSALNAAGAASAALLLSGFDTISTAPSDTFLQRTLPIAEIRTLPGALEVRTVIRSRLFSHAHDAPTRFRPIHRSVAEYLGARWLALSARDDLRRKRLLALFTVDSGVPASLRGLHAWLPHFDSQFATAVISTDPYGLLRYGDADNLSVDQGRQLLRALQRLETENPFFRAEDWTKHSAKGLTHQKLREDIRQILLHHQTTSHLRTLILEAIKDSQVAADLAGDLLSILLNGDGRSFSFSERHDAARAIMTLRKPHADWPGIVLQLNAMDDSDSGRLALTIMEEVGYVHLDAQLVVDAILRHLGFGQPAPDDTESHTSGELYFIARSLPTHLVERVLDELALRFSLSDQDESVDWEQRIELSNFVTRLIVRHIETSRPDSIKLLSWLRIVKGREGYARDELEKLNNYLRQHDDIRHEIQHQVIFSENDREHAGNRLWRLHELNNSLSLSADDASFLLHRLSAVENPSEREVDIWRSLAGFARHVDKRSDEIIAAAQPFALGKPPLEQYLLELTQPPVLASWQIRENERRRQREQERAEAWRKHRRDFKENEEALRRGELRWILGIAHAYLGLFNDSDKTLPPPDRIGHWLGPDLQIAGLAGLEATLLRSDIPTSEQIAESYAESRRWNYVYPLIAALAERTRIHRSIADLPIDVISTVRLALHHEALGDRVNTEALTKALDAQLRQDPAQHERHVRLLIEPYLKRQLTHIPGLYAFARSQDDRILANKLASEWLFTHDKLPLNVEDQLVEVLADTGDLEALRALIELRWSGGYRDREHEQAWLANSIVYDFNNTIKRSSAALDDYNSLLWLLRDRVSGRRTQRRDGIRLSPAQSAWIIRHFRSLFPVAERPSGVTTGDQNAWDATDFLRNLIDSLGANSSAEAGEELLALNKDAEDTYTPYIRFAAEQHRRARREGNFAGVSLENLKAVLELRPPTTTGDLLVIVQDCIARLQLQLRGSDTDIIDKYYRDNGQPREEDWCTDRLIEDIERLLPPYGINTVPQRDMPNGKRVDVVFALGDLALPMECKAQWNRDLWTAASKQLDALYVGDWRAQDRGLLLVYWFGPNVEKAHRPSRQSRDTSAPVTADDLRELLLAQVPAARRTSIFVEVLDLSTKPTRTRPVSVNAR